MFFAVTEVETIAFSIWNGQQIRRDRSSVVNAELRADVVPGGPFLGLVPIPQQILHTLTIGLQNTAITGFGPRRRREPPYTVDRIFFSV